jgi:hypothetical protein
MTAGSMSLMVMRLIGGRVLAMSTYNLNEDAIFSLKFWKPPDPVAASATRLNRVAACLSNGRVICGGKEQVATLLCLLMRASTS